MKFSILFNIFFLALSVAKQTLKSEGTFDDDLERSSTAIERNRAAEERINLSFPGVCPKFLWKIPWNNQVLIKNGNFN